MHWNQKPNFLIAIATLGFMASCALSQKKTAQMGPLPIPENYGPRTIKQITSVGTNTRPHISSDNTKLLYISGQRGDHNNTQAYVKNLVSGVEKRLTYQNGDVFEVLYYNNETRYIYSSSTDELKENSPYIEKSLLKIKGHAAGDMLEKDDLGSVLPRTEIYSAQLDSSQIDRITDRPMFDGDISIRGKSSELAFVRWDKKIPSSFILNIKTKNSNHVGNQKVWTSDPAYSADGDELAWVEKSDDAGWLLLTGTAYGKNGKVRYQTANRLRDLVWHPKGNEIFFSEINGNNAEIFILTLDSGCKRQITFHSTLDLHPYPSSDGNTLYFNSNRTGSFQVFQINLDNLPACPEPKPSLE